MSEPSPNRGVMIALTCPWPLALIPLFLDTEDADVRQHAKNGIALAMVWMSAQRRFTPRCGRYAETVMARDRVARGG